MFMAGSCTTGLCERGGNTSYLSIQTLILDASCFSHDFKVISGLSPVSQDKDKTPANLCAPLSPEIMEDKTWQSVSDKKYW